MKGARRLFLGQWLLLLGLVAFVGATNERLPGYPNPLLPVLNTAKSSSSERDTPCWPGYSSSNTGKDLPTCCWYSETCCSMDIHATFVGQLKANLSSLRDSFGLSDNCYFAVADLMCLMCAPDTSHFITGLPSSPRIALCSSLCEKIYGACKSDLAKFPGLYPENIQNGTSFCKAIWKEEGEDGSASPIVITEGTDSCFTGVPIKQIAFSACLPGTNTSQGTGGDGDGTQGHHEGDGGLSKTGMIIVIVVVVVVVIVVAATVGVGLYLFRRRREQMRMVVMEPDDSFTIPLDAFGEETSE
jgi:hypothetical protein